MVRVLQGKIGKNVDAMCSAAVSMKVGMGVQRKNGEAVFPTEDSCENIYFVKKGVSTTTIDEVAGELSDYASEKQNIAIGEKVLLEYPETGESYFIDQIDGSLANEDYLVVTNAGLFKKATTGTSRFKVVDATYKDCGHAGAKIEVVEPHSIV